MPIVLDESAPRQMELIKFQLGRAKKTALKQRAMANGTSVAEELRTAVDAYLCGVTPRELALLDAASRNAERTIGEMNAMLDASHRRADQVFAELECMRRAASARAPVARDPTFAAAAAPRLPRK